MKKSTLVLFSFIISFVGFSLSGCIATAITGNLPPAGIDVTNNVADTYMTIKSSRSGEMDMRVGTGQTLRIPLCGIPEGNYYTLTAKFWDRSGKYLGVNEMRFSVSFDYSSRYSETWVVDYYIPPIRPVER
ncbi:hypothetical protein KW799_01580 [Candidatus Parcubacteria bacterium]|nr:hypothetical protein [Candidatus Parcubacteria bacterium]